MTTVENVVVLAEIEGDELGSVVLATVDEVKDEDVGSTTISFSRLYSMTEMFPWS